MRTIALAAVAAVMLGCASVAPVIGGADAEPSVTPIGQGMAIERSVIPMVIPERSELPWGSVEGTVSNPVPDHPVIIQIYGPSQAQGNVENGVLFAQVPVAGDGSYEYLFRVSNTVDGVTTSVLAGDYTVVVSKVVYSDGSIPA